MNYKDLENELKKEKQVNNNLKEQLCKLKTESCPGYYLEKEIKIHKEKEKKILEQIIQSPNIQKHEMTRKQSLQRMRHKIPHRFESKINTKLIKCVQCDNQIFLGKTASVCQECNIVAHVTCASLVPKTCGLPNGFVQHFTNSVTRTNSIKNCEHSKELVNVEGWVKIPRYYYN